MTSKSQMSFQFINETGHWLRDNIKLQLPQPKRQRDSEFRSVYIPISPAKTTTTSTLTTNGINVVFIYETHSMESYLPVLSGVTNPNKAWSSKINVGTVAQQIGKNLEKQGIGCVVNRQNVTKVLEDKGLSYAKSYIVSREIVKKAIASNQHYKLFFDIHRDASPKELTTLTINNKTYARIMFVVGESNKHYAKNLAMAKDLNRLLESRYPGLSRGVVSKDKSEGNGTYNQDLSNHALLIEVGGYGNNMKELNHTAEAIATVIKEYYWKMIKVTVN